MGRVRGKGAGDDGGVEETSLAVVRRSTLRPSRRRSRSVRWKRARAGSEVRGGVEETV